MKNKKITYEKNKGSFLRGCPCSPGRLGCAYYILSPGIGCPFNCSYCFLNFYSEKKDVTIYSNMDDMFCEFTGFIDAEKNKPLRLGTGEFMDSLALKELDDVNMELVKILAKRPWAVMEFKTKSNRIDDFLNIKPNKNVVLSWSLNPQDIIDAEEKGTASLKERLTAAKNAVKHGYSIALHLDPIFMAEGYLEKYMDLINTAFDHVPASSVKWLSMGGFRYTDELKLAILEKNDGVKGYLGHEYTRCSDGKFRYPKPLRLKFYNELGKLIKQKGEVKVYMCMEDKALWDRIEWSDPKTLLTLHPVEAYTRT